MAVHLDSSALTERPQLLRLHQRFHKRIADAARCPALSATIEQVLALESTWLYAAGPWPKSDKPRRPHHELVEALAHCNADQAAEGMRQHIAGGVTALMDGLKGYFAKRTSTFVRKYAAR